MLNEAFSVGSANESLFHRPDVGHPIGIVGPARIALGFLVHIRRFSGRTRRIRRWSLHVRRAMVGGFGGRTATGRDRNDKRRSEAGRFFAKHRAESRSRRSSRVNDPGVRRPRARITRQPARVEYLELRIACAARRPKPRIDASLYSFDHQPIIAMPLPLAPFIAFAIGVFLAWKTRTETNDAEPLWNSHVFAVALYALLVFAPVAAYFAAFATDWSCAYLIDGRRVPSAVSLVLVFVAAGSVVAGFVAGRHALGRHAPGELAWLAGLPLAVALVLVIALYERLGVDATYDQFVSDFGREPLFTSRLGLAVAWMDGIVAAGAIITAEWLAPKRQPGQTTPAPVRPARVASVTDDDAQRRFLGRGKTPR